MVTFLDRTVAARRPEKPAESTTGIIPGDRGKVGGSWCRRPLHCRVSGDGRQISPAPLAGVVSGQFITNQELSGQARLETASKPSQVHGPFRPVRRHSYPRGLWLLLCRPERSRVSRRDNPRQKARFAHASRARKGDTAAGSERARQSPSTSSMGQREKARRHTAKANAT